SSDVCSSDLPCSSGEREWLTGHPMMPARRVVPVIFIEPEIYTLSSTSVQITLLGRKRTALAQEAEQLQQRKPENRKMIALDPCEELDAASLEPVGTHRAEYQGSLGL